MDAVFIVTAIDGISTGVFLIHASPMLMQRLIVIDYSTSSIA